ncbi:hypothetical protein [Micromonospora tulbaghiae]|uniref:hypothetical protein n=1 Tax=Micromonospora tulbaghiae TaxID=479978 RepID=UPI0034085A12
MTLRCWWRGIEPDDIHELWTLSEPQPRLLPEWPPGDHTHETTPPTPEQLAERGHAILRRILEDA